MGLQAATETGRDGVDVTERSRYEQRQSEKLDRRRLTAVYGGQAVTRYKM